MVTEFVAAFELTAIGYECSIVFAIGGLPTLGTFIFCILYWRNQSWHDVSASPSPYIVQWIEHKIGIMPVISIVLSQLVGAFVAFSYFTKLYWNFSLSDAHASSINKGYADCQSFIKAPLVIAFVTEAFGFLGIVLARNVVASINFLKSIGPAVNAFIATLIVLLAIPISGGFFNPARASAVQYGCSGSALWEHLLVYWVAHIGAAVFAYKAKAWIQAQSKLKEK